MALAAGGNRNAGTRRAGLALSRRLPHPRDVYCPCARGAPRRCRPAASARDRPEAEARACGAHHGVTRILRPQLHPRRRHARSEARHRDAHRGGPRHRPRQGLAGETAQAARSRHRDRVHSRDPSRRASVCRRARHRSQPRRSRRRRRQCRRATGGAPRLLRRRRLARCRFGQIRPRPRQPALPRHWRDRRAGRGGCAPTIRCLALDGGPDGLEAYRRIAARARDVLTEDGRLLVEIGPGQGKEVAAILKLAGLTPGESGATDLAGRPRVIVAGL